MMDGKYSIREVWRHRRLPWQPNWKSHVMKQMYGRTLVTQTLKGDKKQLKLAEVQVIGVD